MMPSVIRALWNYRGFIVGSVKREFQSKYTNSILGIAWTVIQPLAMIIVYTVIFSQLMKSRLPGVESVFGYSIYLCAGVISWGFFSEVVGRAQNVFIDHANLLKKLSFPRLCLPVILVMSAGLNFLIIFGIFVAFMLATGTFPGWAILAMIPVLVIQVIFSIGLGITLGVLNVFFRDIGQLFGVILQFWFWLTPIVYPVNVLPESIQHLMKYNPMSSIISSYQNIMVYGQVPNWISLWPTALLGLLLCLWGLRLFQKHSGELVDEL
ncbi:ABC transporter permease [Pseudomonas iridis]|uniref:ABC transporter permease n=1 Tax=Pseudomonas iridis TaxID=2710587 RepID=UPI0021BE4861|nr:ABC transporter permease [Pseudomonas iridis]MCT8948350.1 ABC transporter permease [Pseudomonas iridis]